jgi:hypothetical protein
MHACWLLLAASGEIPAAILQSTPPEFVPEGKPLVREIDIHQKDFPSITRPVDGPEYIGGCIVKSVPFGLVETYVPNAIYTTKDLVGKPVEVRVLFRALLF